MFGPTKLNPLPDILTLRIVILRVPLSLTAIGRIRLLPEATVPKLTLLWTVNVVWAAIEVESAKRKRKHCTSLRGEPRRFIYSLSLSMLAEHGGGFVELLGLWTGLNPGLQTFFIFS
jgi:hypothetical protein